VDISSKCFKGQVYEIERFVSAKIHLVSQGQAHNITVLVCFGLDGGCPKSPHAPTSKIESCAKPKKVEGSLTLT
jgi:hypothetical protein